MTWDYVKREVYLTIPGYVENMLHCFQHNPPPNMKHQSHTHVPQNYGARTQYVKPLDDSKPLNKEGKKFITQVTGTFLYYARAVDGPMLTALSAIASEQSLHTECTMNK